MEPNLADPVKRQHAEVGRTQAVGTLKPRKRAGLIAVICIAVFALVAWGVLPRIFQQSELLSHKKSQLAQAPSVSFVTAQLGPAIEEFTLPGNTQAIQDAPIYARINGYLRARYVDIGDQVHAGQVLADIDTPELDKQVEGAQSAVEQAKANLENAREALIKAEADERTAAANVEKAKTDLTFTSVQFGRYKSLAQQGAVSLEDRDTREQAYSAGQAALEAAVSTQKSAQSSIKSARAAVHVAESALATAQSQRDQYEAERSFKKVTALFDGTVVKRNVDAGALITSGSQSNNAVLFEIAKTDVLRIYVYVPEQYVPDIHVGEQAVLTFQAHPGKDFTGTVTNIAGGLDSDSKTLQVEIHVANQDHQLLPGMYAQVTFRTPTPARMVIVPATALQSRPDGAFIYTVDAENRAHMHRVEIGRDLGGQVEIVRGVHEGQKVILNPSDDVQESLLVNPVAAPVLPGTAAKS